jgi:hypothetical protein
MRAFVAGIGILVVLALGAGSAAAASVTADYLRLTDSTVRQLKADRTMREASGKTKPVFIKVGDSNTATHRALYGLGCYRYQPTGLRKSLIDVVRRYRWTRLPLGRTDVPGASCNEKDWSNSFNRVSLAARGGTYFDYALQSGADFGLGCVEATLACEIEATRPRYAFIQFGTNEALFALTEKLPEDELAAVRSQLTTIIRTCRARSVTPVVITAPRSLDVGSPVAAFSGRVIQINTVIRQTAKSNRAPLIDLWLAQSREIGPGFNYGLDQGGVHLASSPNPDPWLGTVNLSIHNRTRYGMNLRSYLILSALDRLDRIR